MEEIGQAVIIIQQYIDKFLSTPSLSLNEKVFGRHSYARWAANEIQDRLLRETDRLPAYFTGREEITPYDIIYNFIEEMEFYISINKATFTFSTAKETAKKILKLLY
jgi:acid phosphatase class B